MRWKSRGIAQGCHGQGNKSEKGIFPGQGKLEKTKQKKNKKRQKSGNLENFWKQMAMAVSLIFRNINLQNRPHSLIKWLFNSLKVSAVLEDLMAEDSCKGSWEAVENVWKMVKSQENVREYWNRKWVAALVAALKINRWHQAMIVELHPFLSD